MEIQLLQRQLREEQIKRSNENRIMQQVVFSVYETVVLLQTSEQNTRLIEENSRITMEVAKMDYEVTRWKEESRKKRRSGTDDEQIIEVDRRIENEKSIAASTECEGSLNNYWSSRGEVEGSAGQV